MEYITLNNGVKMPILGFGTYQIDDLDECEKAVSEAIEIGYRLIDTAQAYYNEEAVGRAIKKSKIPRNEFFITTKVWITNAGYEKAKKSLDESLEKLQTEYIDLVLIHQPFGDYYGTYRAMEEYYKEGKIRAIGVSNFYPDRLVDLASFSEITPAINQIETHPFNQQLEAHKVMEKYDIQIHSWAPFAEGKKDIFNNPLLNEIAQSHNVTPAQVILRWLIQRSVIVIPKSTHKERIAENFNIFDFELTEDDMEKIQTLDTTKSLFFSHADVETVEFFLDMIENE